MANIYPIQEQQRHNKIHPHLLALLIAFASMMMMFVAFSSSLIVRQPQGNWLEFALPKLFYASTGIIVLSSVTLHISYRSFLQKKEMLYKSFLVLTGLLGFTFLYFQYQSWLVMYQQGIYLDGNPSGSFVYTITAVHGAHVLAGIATLLMALIYAFTLPFKVTTKRKVRFQLVLWFWHFVDFVWIYLLIMFLNIYTF